MDVAGTQISAGPYQGLKGIITPYDITVTARSRGGAEVRMRRTLQTITVPVFQFGVFSEGDLSIYADADATITGRVHTNGDLYLSSGDTKTLTLTDRVTAVGRNHPLEPVERVSDGDGPQGKGARPEVDEQLPGPRSEGRQRR